MNGFGHFLVRVRTFQAYWAAAALLLAVVAYLFWVRGTTTDWKGRLRVARSRITRPVVATIAAGVVAVAGLGGFIFYNTNVLNPYVTSYDRQARQADYEKKYKALATAPQPKITAVDVAVDLYPREQRVRMKGRYTLENRTGEPDRCRASLLLPGRSGNDSRAGLSTPCDACHRRPSRSACAATSSRRRSRPGRRPSSRSTAKSRPGASRTRIRTPTSSTTALSSTARRCCRSSAIRNAASSRPTRTARNSGLRRKSGCATATTRRDSPRTASRPTPTSSRSKRRSERTPTSGRSRPATCSANGRSGPRRYFTYRMDSPILNFFAFQSARYEVVKDRWNDVAIEIYYQRGHEYNLQRMIDATKAGLDYFTAAFGPVPAPAVPDHRVPALRDVRAVVSEHDSVLRGDRLHRAGARRRSRGRRLPVLRDRARARAPVVGAPGPRRATCRARRCWSRRWRSTRR